MRCANHEGAVLASTCWKQHLMPKAGEQPVELWANQYCGKTALYYMPEQLEPCTESYYVEQQEAYQEHCRTKAREYRRRKALRRLRARLQEIRRPRTAWQWLSEARRMIRPGARAFPHTYKRHGFNDETGYYISGSSTWYYYQYEDTVVVTDDEYERLKAAYITQFGGWETIDLEHTSYNGHKWY